MRTTHRLILFGLILTTLIIFTYAYNKTFTGKVIQQERANVTRVIDGDTVEVDLAGSKEKIRLLGINTPEIKQPYHDQARDFLREKIEGKEVVLERGNENKDKYSRLLRFIFLGKEFINEEVLQEGFANFYEYTPTSYTQQLKKAEESARNQGKNIWGKSTDTCASCITLSKIQKGKDNCKAGEEYIEFKNTCSFDCDLTGWTLKDDASHIYKFASSLPGKNSLQLYSGQGYDQIAERIFFYQNKDKCASVWNQDKDSVFLRDSQGKLAFYSHYQN